MSIDEPVSNSATGDGGDAKLVISVVTATYNAASHLHMLIESLQLQTDKDFEWVVADGCSSDQTLEILAAAKDLNIKVSSQTDFGIYDALNRAVRLSQGLYYLVVGADDQLSSNAIADFKQAIASSSADIISADYEFSGAIRSVRTVASAVGGLNAIVSQHSVASVYRRTLHDDFGYYSRKFPIAADFDFVLRAYKGGAKIFYAPFVAGSFGSGGVSSLDIAGSLCEVFRVQIRAGEPKLFQVALLVVRLLRHFSRL